VIVPGPNGVSDFAVLQKELRGTKPSQTLVMYAFDLLYLNGVDLRREPLIERKAKLARLIGKSQILYSEHFEIEAAEMLRRVCAMGLEGVVSKERYGRYQSDRTGTWLKVPCRQRETLRIVGYALKQNRFDGLYLGREKTGELLYAGKVDHGFTRNNIVDVQKRLKPLIQKAQAFSRKIKKPNAVWVKPDLFAEVEYRAQSAEGRVRHPSFKGLREDL
jgi:bifunctional non-homologous end joining protein LigD